MRLFTLLLLLILTAIGAFATFNWRVFVTPTDLSLGVIPVYMPLGIVMLGLLVFITVLFLLFVVYLQTSSLLETRRLSRKLEANITLAEKAEASRFTELRNALEAEMVKQANLSAESRSAILARIDLLSKELHTSIEQSGNTLAAHIGEFEDRFEKSKTLPQSGQTSNEIGI
ncbi:MAG: LapA family protein [Burkholderiaceae bacterium]|nr:LapA family protein [Burkholderiaceae bacterium]